MSPLELQRIVDGELDHSARAQILGTLGDDVREWRSLALALLEEQRWAGELKPDSFADHSIPDRKPSRNALSVHTESIASPPFSIVPNVGRKGPLGSPWFTALAASVLLCIGVTGGMLLRSSRERNTNEWIASQGSDANRKTQRIETSESKPELDRKLPMKMVLSPSQGSQTPPVEIPLIDAKDIDPNTLWARDAQELSKLQQKLKREGYRMEWEPRFYSGRLNDGREIVVPVHNVALKSVGL